MAESFGPRLRSERERRKIALETIAANTKIGIGLLKALERDDVSRWPSGVFRAMFDAVRREAQAAGAGGLRLYVDNSNARAQAVYRAVGMTGDHYRVFEDMFVEPQRA